MADPRAFLGSTIGRKVAMAVTGLVLFGFVIGHMVGNLQLYLGPDALNEYAVWLREILHGAGLWIARGGLLASAVLHIWAATSLTLESRRARDVGYRRWAPEESTYASRTMRWGGVIILLFVVFHLLDFTFGSANPDFRPHDVYHNVVASFRRVPVSVAYMVAMVALGFHLRHGAWSMLRTLGLAHPRYTAWAKHGALGFALVVTAGNLSFPIAVLAGLVR